MEYKLLSAVLNGEQTLGIPAVRVNDYLELPRIARWPVFLGIAMMWQLCHLFLEGDREAILSLIKGEL